MRTQTRSGFTIIEVMLFLAITGALTVAILVGSGAAINRQRYRDSVNSFKGLIQEQYGQVSNVVNSETRNPSCSWSAAELTLNDNEDSKQARGTSDCLIIGRFLLIHPTTTATYNVIGHPPNTTNQTGDSNLLGEYAMTLEGPEDYEISWGAQLVNPGGNTPVTAGVLVVRSPASGSLVTYVRDVPATIGSQDYSQLSTVIKEMVHDSNMVQRDFCVDSEGALSNFSRRQAVRIKAYAASQSAVEVPLEEDNVCS